MVTLEDLAKKGLRKLNGKVHEMILNYMNCFDYAVEHYWRKQFDLTRKEHYVFGTSESEVYRSSRYCLIRINPITIY